MTGCEYMKCGDFIDGKCTYSGLDCKYRQTDQQEIEQLRSSLAEKEALNKIILEHCDSLLEGLQSANKLLNEKETALAEWEKECERLREWIQNDCIHKGHATWCNAIRGPEHEEWIEEKLCDCGRKQALEGK